MFGGDAGLNIKGVFVLPGVCKEQSHLSFLIFPIFYQQPNIERARVSTRLASPRLVSPAAKIAELLLAPVKRGRAAKRLLLEIFPHTKAQNGFISF